MSGSKFCRSSYPPLLFVSIGSVLSHVSLCLLDLTHVLFLSLLLFAPLPLFFVPFMLEPVRMDRRSVFLAYWLLRPGRLFFSGSPPCPCPAELVMEPIDWSAVGPIDPQGRTAGYWRMVLQCPPSLPPSSYRSASLPLLYFLSSLSALLNLSLTSFHLQPPHPLFLHFPHSSTRPSTHSSFPPSLLRPLSRSFIDAAEIDAEDNGRRARGELAAAAWVHGRGAHTAQMMGRGSKDELTAGEVRVASL